MSLIEKMRELVKDNPQLSMALEEGIAYGRKKKAEREGNTELAKGEALNISSKDE